MELWQNTNKEYLNKIVKKKNGNGLDTHKGRRMILPSKYPKPSSKKERPKSLKKKYKIQAENDKMTWREVMFEVKNREQLEENS